MYLAAHASVFGLLDLDLKNHKPRFLSFSVTSSDGTAVDQEDYLATSNLLVPFLSGQATQLIGIHLLDDNLAEGEESFVLSLQLQDPSQQDAELGPRTTLTIIIEDDEELQLMSK